MGFRYTVTSVEPEPGERNRSKRQSRTLRWLRIVLVILLGVVGGLCWATGLLPGVAARTPTAVPVEQLRANDPASWSSFVLAGGAGCSGTLVGPSLVLTAAHCLYDSDGGQRSAAVAHFGVGGVDDATRLVAAQASCEGDWSWAPSRRLEAPDRNDWALLGLRDCYGPNGRFLGAPGDLLGHARVGEWDAAKTDRGVYLGYPRTDDGALGVFQSVTTSIGYRPLLLRLADRGAESVFSCSLRVLIRAGGSGGGLLDVDGATVRAVDSFAAHGRHACFRQVTRDMVEAVRRARSDPPTGHDRYAPVEPNS